MDIPEYDADHPEEILSKNIGGGEGSKQETRRVSVEVSIKYIQTQDGGTRIVSRNFVAQLPRKRTLKPMYPVCKHM